MCFDAIVESALAMFEGEFELGSVNEAGSNGFVLIGRHTILDRPAVIKAYSCDPSDVREPSLLASFEHENIVKVYHACRDNQASSVCYFMEACSHDLGKISFLSGHCTLRLLDIIQGVLTALSHMHNRDPQLVHGDIKHENVLLKDNVAKICDFGSAFELSEQGNLPPQGSILFKPPEVLSCQPSYNALSDLYQVGLLGYSLFGGVLDYDLQFYLTKKQRETLQTLDAGYAQSAYVDGIIGQVIRSGHIARWKSLPSLTANRIIRILKKATSLDPTKRYQSASSMLIDLNNIRGQVIDWTRNSEREFFAEYSGKKYRLCENKQYWCSYAASTNGTWRQKHSTKDKTLDGCIHKMKAEIKADRDS